MPTGKQDKDFASAMEGEFKVEAQMSTGALDSAIVWIAKNLDPDDVFSKNELQNWAESNGYVKQ